MAERVTFTSDGTRRGLPAARLGARARSLWERRREPPLRAQAAALAVFAAGLFAFAHIVEDYLTGDPIVRWDVEFARWLHDHSSPALRTVFEVVTTAGNVAVLAAVTAAALLLLLRRGRIDDALLLAGSALGIEIVNGLLKLAFHRPRPELGFVHLDTYSFPSGHAAGSAAIYTVLAVLAARSASRRTRVLLALATVLLVAAISFSRLYLGAHYLSDVLAGISLGLAWAGGCLFLYLTLPRRRSRVWGSRFRYRNRP